MKPSPLKDAIMDAVYVPIERDDMRTPCALPFMTSSKHGVCDGDGCPVSDETIASALNAVAKIQTEYYKVKKETQKETQNEMTNEPSPRPWRVESDNITLRPLVCFIIDANGAKVSGGFFSRADAALIVDAVNAIDATKKLSIELYDPIRRAEDERDRLRDLVREALRAIDVLYTVAAPGAIVKELTPDVTCLGIPIGKIVTDARTAIGEGVR